jgi:hypothetical protein
MALNRSARSTETLINTGIVIGSLLHAQYSQLYERLNEQTYLVNRGSVVLLKAVPHHSLLLA